MLSADPPDEPPGPLAHRSPHVPSPSPLSPVPSPPPPNTSALPLQLISTALSIGPTLLPPQLSNLITALSLATKISLRATAFFIEAILESARYGTSLGFGLTRRALITAVGSARTFYVVKEGLDWAGGKMNQVVPGLRGGEDAFLNVLDKYTNLGIYLITHTFTLAELFAMSGFYLTSTTLHTGIAAAQESVSLFDGIFGSNETSRALASVIALVRKEFGKDDRSKKGTVAGLASLTKAMTAFACLQNATWKRTAGGIKQRVLFDCVVVGQLQQNFDNASSDPTTTLGTSSATSHPTSGPSSAPCKEDPLSSSSHSISRSRNPPSYPDDDGPYLLTDVRSALKDRQAHPSKMSPSADSSAEEEEDEEGSVVWELENLVGEDPDGFIRSPKEREVERHRKWVGKWRQKRSRSDVSRTSEGEGTNGVKETVEDEDDELYEVTEHITEHITETRMVEHYNHPDEYSRWIRNGSSTAASPLALTPWNRTGSSTPTNVDSDARLPAREEEDWIEVDGRSKSSGVSTPTSAIKMTAQSASSTVRLPSAPNGLPIHQQTLATQAYNDAFEHPEANSARVQVILKTITRKLLEKKRTIRRLPGKNASALSSFDVLEQEEGRADGEDTWGPSESRRGSEGRGEVGLLEPMTPPPSPEVSKNLLPGDRRRGDVRSVDWGNGFERDVRREEEEVDRELMSFSPDSNGYAATPSSHESAIVNGSASNSKPPGKLFKAFSKARASLASSSKKPKTDNQPISPPSTMNRVPAEQFESGGKPLILDAAFQTSSRTASNGTHPSATSSPEKEKGKPKGHGRQTESSFHQSHNPSITSSQSSVLTQEFHYSSTTQAPPSPEAHPEGLFPYDHLVRNIHKFCRYSSAAYGQNFLRILGMGQTDFMFPSTGRYHANSWAFAQHTNLPIDALLLSSYADPAPSIADDKLCPLVHYIAVDHEAKAIVLTCRGTLGLSDVLVDLTCEYKPIPIEGGDPDGVYMAHSGMLYSASRLMNSNSTVHETIKQALIDYPAYGLVLTGHSLGGGVAALLSILWSCPTKHFLENLASHESVGSYPSIGTKFVTNISSGLPAGRPIHAYVYGPPCVASSDLARYARDLITCVVQGNDIVPSLSLGTLRDFRNVALTLGDEGNVAEEIVGRVVGIYQRRLRDKYGSALLNGSSSNPIRNTKQPPSLKSLQDAEQAEKPEIVISKEELNGGRSRNYAQDQDYTDSTLKPGRLEENLKEDEDEQKMLDDWFFSLIKTMRADMDNDKLYPPGRVYQMEHWTVFVTDQQKPGAQPPQPPQPNKTFKHSSHQEAHRIVLKAVEDVEKKFGELTFSRSMLQDHVPSRYEQGTQLLYDGMFGS